jgi:hypothetical protein
MIGYRFGDLRLLNVFDQHIKSFSPYSLGREIVGVSMFWFEILVKNSKSKPLLNNLLVWL